MKPDGNSLKVLIGWALLAVLLLLLTGQSGDRAPTTSGSSAPRALAAGGNETGEKGGKRAHAANSEENWTEVENFMKTKSPKKWAVYDKLPEAAKVQLRGQLIARYNEVSKLAPNKPLHDLEVERVQIEDEIFAALSERKRNHSQGEFSPEYLHAVERLVKNRMQERKVRLEDLRNMVKEDDIVSSDASTFKKFILGRAQAIEKHGVAAGAQGIRRRLAGQPATDESEEEVLPGNPK